MAGIASAQTPSMGWGIGATVHAGARGTMPGVFGTVSAINGTTLTLTSKDFGGPQGANTSASAKTYTVDASNATVFKSGATSTLAVSR